MYTPKIDDVNMRGSLFKLAKAIKYYPGFFDYL